MLLDALVFIRIEKTHDAVDTLNSYEQYGIAKTCYGNVARL